MMTAIDPSATPNRGECAHSVEGVDDLTPALHADEALRESEARLRLALSAARATLFTWDIASDLVTRFQSSEPALPMNVGRPQRLEDVRKIIHHEDRAEFDAHLQDSLYGRGEYRNAYRVARPDGTFAWIEEWGAVERDDRGEPARLTGVAIDVTERERSRQDMRVQSWVLQSMAEGVNMSNEAGRLIYVNPALEKMFGYGPGEMVGSSVDEMNAYPPEENRRVIAGILAAIDADGEWRGEFHNRRKDGSEFTTYAHITPLGWAAGATSWPYSRTSPAASACRKSVTNSGGTAPTCSPSPGSTATSRN